MSTSRPQAPGNLKERIAALQQRNVSPSQNSPPPASKSSPPSQGSGGSLRDRIARFEKKGGVPVPRGSFGLGAVNPENSQARRLGELYGNRVPGLNAPAKQLPLSRSSSPSPQEGSIAAKGRSFTLSGLDTDRSLSPSPFRKASSDVLSETDDDILHSSPSISPTSTDPSPLFTPSSRRNSFAVALESARRRESISSELELLFASRTQLSGTIAVENKEEEIAGTGEEVESQITTAPAVVVSSGRVLAEEADTVQSPEVEGSVTNSSPVTNSPSNTTFTSSDITLEVHSSSPPDSDPETSMNESDTETPRPSMDTSSFRPPADDIPNTSSVTTPASTASLEGEEEAGVPRNNNTTPTLRSNIDLDVDSPILTDYGSIPSSTMSEDTAVDSASEEIKGIDYTIGERGSTLQRNGETKTPFPVLATEIQVTPLLSLPRIPTSSSEPSLTTMKPSRGAPTVSVTRRPSRSSNKSRIPVIVPPTSYIREEEELYSEYGSVTVLTQSYPSPHTETQQSNPDVDLNRNASGQQVLAFKAVVHKKITETPSTSITPIHMTPSMSQMAQVAQVARVRRLTKNNMLEASESPVHQELAVLLEEAARLEQSLSDGHIPSEDNGLLSEGESSASEDVSGQLPDDTADVPPIPPPKPHKTPKYLSGLRKLKRSSAAFRTLPSFPRQSISASSEMSSEDSMAVATPPDSFDSSGETQSPVYEGNTGLGIGWPSVSPRKSPSLRRASSRASSFADKIFSRNRTRSTASSVYTQADSISDYAPPLAPIIVPPVPPFPSSDITPLDGGAYARSHSPSRRLSWLSHSSTSTSSPTSPLLLNKDVCDAFPSVPQQRPHPIGSSLHALAPPRPSFGTSHTSSSQPHLSPSLSHPIYDSMSLERNTATSYTTRKPSIPSH